MDVSKLNDGKTEAILSGSKTQQSTVNSLGVGESEMALCGYTESKIWACFWTPAKLLSLSLRIIKTP